MQVPVGFDSVINVILTEDTAHLSQEFKVSPHLRGHGTSVLSGAVIPGSHRGVSSHGESWACGTHSECSAGHEVKGDVKASGGCSPPLPPSAGPLSRPRGTGRWW